MLWTNRGCDTDYFCPIETPPPTRYHVDVMPGLTTNRFVNFSTNGIAPEYGNRLKPTFSLANFTPRGGRFLGVWGTKKKSDSLGGRVTGLHACCVVFRAQTIACARSKTSKNMFRLCCVFFPCVYCFFCKFFWCLRHVFFLSFLLWFCVVVSVGFFLSFPLSPLLCVLLKHCICNPLLICFASVVLSRLIIF